MGTSVIVDLKETGCKGIDGFELPLERVQWRIIVNMEIKFRFHKGWEISSDAERLSASQEGLCSVKLIR
jgi:hypothetical protein